MSKVQEFMEMAKADETVKAKITELYEKAGKLSDVERDEFLVTEITKLAAEKGFDLVKEDFLKCAAGKRADGKLSDEDLAAVSGGASEDSFWGILWWLLAGGGSVKI